MRRVISALSPVLVVGAVTVVCLPARVHACVCVSNGCQVAPRSGVLFLATVGSVEPPSPQWRGGPRVVKLTDVTPLRGDAPTELESAGSDCDYEFSLGVRYFIEAHEIAPGRFGAAVCGMTRPATHAAGVIAVAAGRPRAPRPSLWGTVTEFTMVPDRDRGAGPAVAGATVRLRSRHGGGVRETRVRER